MRLRALPILIVAALAATTTWVAPAQAAAPTARCVASAPSRGTAAQIVGIAESVRRDLDLSAAIVRVTVGGREVVTAAVGDSMTGIPATTDMRFRTGSVGIAYLNVLLLQLVDKGTVKLDEPIARWFPSLPKANKVTLRMLGSNTSGYPDFESYAPFVKALYADPFQNWTEQEVIDLALSRDLWYEPGTNWSYSHANFVILGRILERITRTPLKQLLTRDVLNPLRLSATVIDATAAIPEPVLHGYTIERGVFEDSTYWNPSWTTAHGAVLTQNICDLATSARAVGAGRLISAKSLRTQLNPGTVGLGGPTKTCPATICIKQTTQHHYGLGLSVKDGWIQQTPSFAGYSAVQSYLPGKDIAIAVATSRGRTTTETNSAPIIAEKIGTLLANQT
ncbi:MAG TPA: serine hydrolase domain-containing protein [Asanoa sp.]|jgi:D-alanyl-D-alanine carboxypeptidase|nr:serine hydrolase domain-containing protein [Asanoa sp.]